MTTPHSRKEPAPHSKRLLHELYLHYNACPCFSLFFSAPHNFRLYATTPLENIHSDLAVETCLNLIRQEKDADVRGDLAHALLSHFSVEGVEVVRQLLLAGTLGRESRDVRSLLLETCTIMGERIPEYDDWQTAEKVEKEEHSERVKELEDDPAGLLQFAFEKLKQESFTSSEPKENPPVTPQNTQRVGRNDPCPCGSGKKFKKCCLNKSSGDPLLN